MQYRGAPSYGYDKHLDKVAKSYHGYESADYYLQRPKATFFEQQDAVSDKRRDQHRGDQRYLEQQRQSDACAEKFRQVGRHRGHFAHDPHRPHKRPGELLATHLGEIATGNDAELGRQGLI